MNNVSNVNKERINFRFYVFYPVRPDYVKKPFLKKEKNWEIVSNEDETPVVKKIKSGCIPYGSEEVSVSFYKVCFNSSEDIVFAVLWKNKTLNSKSLRDLDSMLSNIDLDDFFSKTSECIRSIFKVNDYNAAVDNSLSYKFAAITLKGIEKLPDNAEDLLKLILFESRNMATSNIEGHIYTSEGRFITSYLSGTAQIILGREHREKEKIKDIVRALAYKLHYRSLSIEVSKSLADRNFKEIVKLRERLIRTDADSFYLNPATLKQPERFFFWKNLAEALEIKQNRDLVLEQVNLIGSSYEEKLREERNKIETQRNFILTILALMIGITGANYYQISSQSTSRVGTYFKILSNNILLLTTAITPIILLIFFFSLVKDSFAHKDRSRSIRELFQNKPVIKSLLKGYFKLAKQISLVGLYIIFLLMALYLLFPSYQKFYKEYLSLPDVRFHWVEVLIHKVKQVLQLILQKFSG